MLTPLDIENAVQDKTLTLTGKQRNDKDIALICSYLKEHSKINALNLCYNVIGDEGAKALADIKTLTTLNLRYNRIGDEGAKALADNKTLTSLNLCCNAIGDEGAKALADNKSLTSLNLRSNAIGDEGAKALADNKTLTSLNLRGNVIGAEGAKALANNKTLTSLNLVNNKISDTSNAIANALETNTTLLTCTGFENNERIQSYLKRNNHFADSRKTIQQTAQLLKRVSKHHFFTLFPTDIVNHITAMSADYALPNEHEADNIALQQLKLP